MGNPGSQHEPDAQDFFLQRIRELENEGAERSQAFGRAALEMRIRSWPSGWGDDLVILIYGDFAPPKTDAHFKTLDITVHPEKVEKSPIQTAMCVLKASVKLKEKSISALANAARRINILLGSWTLVDWGNSTCRWWSYVTHGTGSGMLQDLSSEEHQAAVEGIMRLDPPIRNRIEAALYWFREPQSLLREFYRSDILRVYAGYWNAFECLVGAFDLASPRPELSRSVRQQRLGDFMSERVGKTITIGDIEKCYREIVNPGFVAKAKHALCVGFKEKENAEFYFDECFKRPDKENRLYNIRNAINHGDIDAENPEEIIRIESRLQRLRYIVLAMFGIFTPFPFPIDPDLPVQPGDKSSI